MVGGLQLKALSELLFNGTPFLLPLPLLLLLQVQLRADPTGRDRVTGLNGDTLMGLHLRNTMESS